MAEAAASELSHGLVNSAGLDVTEFVNRYMSLCLRFGDPHTHIPTSLFESADCQAANIH